MKIYETPNPFFLSDIFVFAEVEEIGLCYIKVNCFNRIEEIGFDIQRRMCRSIEDIMKSAKKAAKIRRHIFNSIDIEYWGKIHDNPELLKKSQNFSPTCATCNSYDNGKCTNFGKEVKAGDSCKYYQSDVIEYTCQQCGHKYEIIDSDAGDREKFCCKACENGH